MYEDKTLKCKDCGNEFVFTAGEQAFYAERGFQNEPQRCKACRDARKNSTRGPREFFTATCARCGGEAKVPFEPKSDRPVFSDARQRLIHFKRIAPPVRWGDFFMEEQPIIENMPIIQEQKTGRECSPWMKN